MKRVSRDSYLKRFGASFRDYQFKSIFFQYFKYIFLAFSIVILAAAVIFFFTSRASREKEYRLEAEKSFISSANGFDLAMQNTVAMHRHVMENSSLSILMLRSAENFEDENITRLMGLRKFLAAECAGNSIYDSINIYLSKSGYIISVNGTLLMDKFHDTAWLELAESGKSVIVTRSVESMNRRVISIIKPLTLGGELYGYVCYNLRYNYFGRLFGNVLETPQQNELSILNEDGVYIFSSDETKLESVYSGREEKKLIESSTDLHDDFINAYMDGDDTVLFYRSSFERITLLYRIRENGLSTALREIFIAMVIVVPVAILLCALLSALIALHMYDHIFRILRFFESSTYNPVEDGRNEITEIQRNIFNITVRQRSLENEFAQKLIELKKAQTIALQTQINPHFLLNTLQALCFTIIRDCGQTAGPLKIISLLSDILRSNLNTHDYMVELKKEIEVTEKYLEIESIRNGGMFRVEWDIPDNTRDKRILRFMLQPILENSILHGLVESKKPKKLIRVTSRVEKEGGKGFISIMVADNGVGMSAEMLEQLRQRLTLNYMPENKEIGIANVNLRLKLLFGTDALITVDSEKDVGTEVKVRVPLID